MATKTITLGNFESLPREYVSVKDKKKGDVLANGLYKDTWEGNYGLNHTFRNSDNTETVINGTAQINKLMEKVEKGSKVKVTYQGMEPAKTGKFIGKPTHAYTVEIYLEEETAA